MALAGGGAFSSVTISDHTRTAAEIIARFTGRATQFEDAGEQGTLVRIA